MNISETISKLISTTSTKLKSLSPLYIFGGSIVLMIIVYIFMFNGSDKYKKENKILKEEVKVIQKQRDSINNEIQGLKKSYVLLEEQRKNKEDEILKIDSKLRNIEDNLYNQLKSLSDIKGDVSKINVTLKNRIDNPIKRTGDSLLNSLDKKLN